MGSGGGVERAESLSRRGLRVRGVVQGVGFRPAMLRWARRCGVAGFVRNDDEGVWIEIQGPAAAVAGFVDGLPGAMPPEAHVVAVEIAELAPAPGADAFVIAESAAAGGASRASIPPDLAPCAACVRELDTPGDRRHRHAFIACTDCGPRFSVARALPYDRCRTTMDAFPLCADCAAEYGDPDDRRFHAQANACRGCGPSIRFFAPGESARVGDLALEAAVRALGRGAILAVKGVGGYVLALDASNEVAVARLRARKRRPHKPLAVMARDLEWAERIAVLDEPARRALVSAARPIVLVPRREGVELAAGVAPRLSEIGVFLPPSPLQYLLLRMGPPLQIMTSGNVSGEPIAKGDDEAVAKLAEIADAFLSHDRAIVHRLDDSVVRPVDGGVQLVRRARGYVPAALPLSVAGPAVLAVGAELKSTVCLAAAGEAILSTHLGDLEHPEALAELETWTALLPELGGVRACAVAHDMHPDYRSTQWALASGLPPIAVQHHHAHVAACLAEHGRSGPAIGVAFDGTGCGADGSLWGGEILVFDYASAERRGHLIPLPLPGGEMAVREPWRAAVGALSLAGEPIDVGARVDAARVRAAEAMVRRNVRAPRATGAGRWFDAFAAMCGVCDEVTYEGQAAIELEAAAAQIEADGYPFAIDIEGGRPFVVDLRPSVRGALADLRRRTPPELVAARVHETMAQVVAASCRCVRAGGGPALVVLSGGCFQSRRLTERALTLLRSSGFEVLVHRAVPPNDGGIAFGQAAIASVRLARARKGAHPSCA